VKVLQKFKDWLFQDILVVNKVFGDYFYISISFLRIINSPNFLQRFLICNMKKKYAIILVLVIILIGIFFTYLLYQEVEKQTLETQKKQQKIFLHQLSSSIEHYFDDIFSTLKNFSEKENVKTFNESSKQEFKNFYEAHSNEIKALTRVSETGKIIYTFPFVKEAINVDISNQAHNKLIIETHKAVISEIFTSVQGYKTIVAAYPIFNNGNYNGSISLLLNFDKMVESFVHPIASGNDFSGIVLSKTGEEIYFSQDLNNHNKETEANINKSIVEQNISDILKGNIFSAKYLFSSKKNVDFEKNAVYKKVNLLNTYWVIGIIINVEEVMKTNRGFITKLAMIFLFVGSFIVGLSYLFFKSEKKNAELIKVQDNLYKNELKRMVEDRTEELNRVNKSLEEDLQIRKRIEEKLIDAIEKAEKSEKIKSNFLAQMSHEIRTPLNTILSFSFLIRDEVKNKVSEDLNQGFDAIYNAGKRVIRTIDLILNMSDVQAGAYEILPIKINILSDVLEKILREYSSEISKKNLHVEIIKLTDNFNVVADMNSVSEIFSQIIDNAFKYTSKGKIQIDILRNEFGYLKTIISDTGIGISKEYLPNIFGEFSQEEMGYTRSFEGNGLGLALVKKFCELNNIEISVESTKEVGTTFFLTFNN
jgi:signal transduction histidine kinase